FIAIAFSGALPGPVLITMIATQWLLKTAYEVAATPLTYAVVSFLKRKEGIDTFDYDTNFNPLLVAD
nr:hypothetical protein [Dehalococcoidales bacterium]